MIRYPGQGRILNKATYNGTSPAAIVYPTTPIIPTSGYTEWEALNDSQETAITITYNTAPAAVTTIEYAADPLFADFIILDTIPLSATDKIAVLTLTQMLPGFIRINNTSTSQINSVAVQKQTASVG